MREIRPVEVAHVGEALREHRENHSVTLEQMIAYAGGEHAEQLAAVEKSRGLDPWFLETHHSAMVGAWETGAPKVSTTVAIREQWYTTADDWRLWQQTMTSRPQVAWWWGMRTDMTPAGAYCYACDALIYSYNVSRGMTKPARAAVMMHRYGHMIVLGSLATTQPKESTP